MSMTIDLKFTGQTDGAHRKVAEAVIEAVKTALDNAELAYNPTINVIEDKCKHQFLNFPDGKPTDGWWDYEQSEIRFLTTIHKD